MLEIVQPDAVAGQPVPSGGPLAEAVSALVALGYKAQEASKMIQKIHQEGLDSGELIRLALRGAA